MPDGADMATATETCCCVTKHKKRLQLALREGGTQETNSKY